MPEASCYKDVNSDTKFCSLSMETITTYLEQFDKELECDLIKNFYNEKFLRYFRLATEDDKLFVRSSCHAEMRKAISYQVDIVLDKSGLILESQCECGAGMGPHAHCKHVCIVLYGAYMFTMKNTVKTEETCTQKLQNFHKCKKFIGSPLKASQLEVPGADEFTNMNFDPRPAHLRNNPGYGDFFRNTCLNFSGVSTMPIFQLFTPANSLAVAHDHDYLQKTPEDNFLERILVTNISEQDRKNIEQRTHGQSGNPLWAEERTKRLPSSQFGRICKAMSENSKADKEKLARSLVVTSKINAPSLQHGLKYEKIAISKFMLDSGCDVEKCGLVVSQDHPFLSCSPDGVIDSTLLLEVKCPYSAKDKPISHVTVPYLKQTGESEYFLEQTHDYYYQIQGQLLCTGAKKCILAVYTIVDIKYITLERNEIFIENMVAKLKAFFENYFKPALLEKRFYKTFIE